MTVADDLRAAKALIGTPEKLAVMSADAAIRSVTVGRHDFLKDLRAMCAALSSEVPAAFECEEGWWRYYWFARRKPHAEVMALFQRAIDNEDARAIAAADRPAQPGER